jgi:hypothetical protein
MSEHDELPQDERISALYRMGQGRTPPAHLDEEIRREAQREIRRRRQRILWPSLATAAVLVLSFTLVLQLQDQGGLDGSPMTLEREPAAPSSAALPEQEVPRIAAPQTEGGAEVSAGADGAAQGVSAPREERKLKVSTPEVRSRTAAPEPRAEKAPAMESDFESYDMERSAEPPALEKAVVGVAPLPAVPACGGILPAPDAAPEEWRRIYAQLRQQENQEQAECLQKQFRLKFGRDIQDLGAGAEKPDR